MDEINALVEEYNEAEAAQEVRLRKLFDLLGARKGYRCVRFAGKTDDWTNAWGPPYQERPDISYAQHLKDKVTTITEVTPGHE